MVHKIPLLWRGGVMTIKEKDGNNAFLKELGLPNLPFASTR